MAVVLVLGFVCAAVGTVGGIGGAAILVPLLVMTGMSPSTAAPLGMVTVAAGSLAAAARHIDSGVVHHRLGTTVELAGAVGALVGATASAQVSDSTIERVLAGAALASATVLLSRRGVRNKPDPERTASVVGEAPGPGLAGTYRLDGQVVAYRVERRIPTVAAIGVAGVVAGLSGTSGGYLKTPIMSELGHVPVRVAAATTTFIVGITAVSALAVYAGQGRIDARLACAATISGLAGGALGSRLLGALRPEVTRAAIGAVLVTVAVLLLAR